MSTETEEPPAKKPSAKKAAKKPDNKKAALAKGAEAIRKAKEAEKKKVSPATRYGGELEVLPKIVESKEDMMEIVSRRVKMSPDSTSLTIDADTTVGEYLKVFDYVIGLNDGMQFLVGDLVNEGSKLKCFGEKYVAAMASTGRSINTLKAYASAAKHIPPSLRKLASYTYCREVVKVPLLADKKAILQEVVAAEKSGKPLTSKEVRAKAAKFAPVKVKKGGHPKKAPKEKAPPLIMSAQEREHLIEMEDVAARLVTLIGTGSYAIDISGEEKMSLREKLDTIARFAAQLRD